MFFYLIVIVLLLLLFLSYVYFNVNVTYWTVRGVKYVEEPTYPFGNLWPLMKAEKSMTLEMYEFYKKTEGPYGALMLFNQPALLIKDPELLKHILVKDFNYFTDRLNWKCNEKEPLAGHLFRLVGQKWRFVRSKLQQGFTVGKIKMMFEALDKTSKQLDVVLESCDNQEINVVEQTVKYTSDSIASIFFGIEVNSFVDQTNEYSVMVATLLNTNYLRYFIFMMLQFTPKLIQLFRINSLFMKSNKQVFSMVKEVMRYREENNLFRNDFMQLMIQLKNNGNISETNLDTEKLSLPEISASIYSLFFAGFETCSNTISFCLYNLALRPDIQNRLHEEICDTLEIYGGQLTYESIMKMQYLECVINETLRMYPPLGFISRGTVKDYQLPDSNLIIEKGTLIYVSLFGLHNDPKHFPNPDEFNPDRFLPENKQTIQSFSFIPFGDGMRYCIGKKLAYLMTSVALVKYLKRYSVKVCDKTPKNLTFSPLFLSTSTQDLYLRLSKRIAD